MDNDFAIQEFANAIKEPPTDTNTNYSAVVSRVDDEGVAWVHLQGSEKETPTAASIAEVKKGDRVTVTWKNNGLYIGGNYTDPSAGVGSVRRIEDVANDAHEAANNAVLDAERARVAAESAEADALRAADAATSAQESASNAGESASQAQAASQAAQAAALGSITTDTIHYLATDLGSGVTTSDPPAGHGSWSTTVQTMTATNKYLWTYHTYSTAGGATSDTTPVITGTYGEKGADGTSVTILGSYNTLAELQQAHPTGARGDAYMVSGDLYVWNGSAWENVGQIQGPQGPQGIQGNSVTVSSVAYAVTTTEAEPQSWPHSTVPTVPEGSWLWVKTTYSDGSTAITKAKQGVSGTNGTNGRDGIDGTDGADGADGVSVTSVQPQYFLSTSSVSPTGGSWSTTLSYVVGKFIWTRDYITYSDSSDGFSEEIYNEALTQSCENAAQALGLINEQQQYFYHDTLGAHVISSPDTTNTRYRTDIVGSGLDINQLANGVETSIASFGSTARIGRSDASHVEIGASNGMNVFDENNKLRMNASSTGISMFAFDENNNRVNVAQFATTARIGEADKQYVRIGSNAFSILRELGNSWLIAFMGYGTVNGQSGTGNAPYYILGQRNANLSTTYGENSVSESRGTATGYFSHAEGTGEASGHWSHAENNGKAKGDSSHAGGQACEAIGDCSTATGQFTSAKGECQVAIGKYNAEDTTSALIIGNGTSVITRSNAMSVDFNGNMTLAGGITVKGHNSAIGTILDRYLDRNLSVAHNTGTALCGVELPIGVWLLQAWVRFPSNATGMRACNISTTSGAADWQMSTAAVNGGVTQLHFTRVINVTSLDIYYLNVVQTSGSAMTLATGAANGINSLRAVRIA